MFFREPAAVSLQPAQPRGPGQARHLAVEEVQTLSAAFKVLGSYNLSTHQHFKSQAFLALHSQRSWHLHTFWAVSYKDFHIVPLSHLNIFKRHLIALPSSAENSVVH